MTMPNFTSSLLDRFELCNHEIAGVAHVNRVAPLLINPSNSMLPMIYMMPDTAATVQQSRTYIRITRDYLLTGLVKAVALDRRANVLGDSELVGAAIDFESAVMGYYLQHPRLHTSGLPLAVPPTSPLPMHTYLAPDQDIQIASSQIITLGEIGGEQEPKRPAYVGILIRIRTVVQWKAVG
jgi:hypothetical protein